MQETPPMKLFTNSHSPFARKVRVSALELGLDGRIENLEVSLTPVSPHAGLRERNPLGKIPALITDAGEALYDSPVICEYLDALAGGNRLFPANGPARWRALRRQALADGIADAAVLVRYETAARPVPLQWREWLDGQWLKIRSALDALEHDTLDGPFDIGVISIACALGYLDLRFPQEPWRQDHPSLSRWLGALAERESLAATRPG
jgi:glutathione S-transferase